MSDNETCIRCGRPVGIDDLDVNDGEATPDGEFICASCVTPSERPLEAGQVVRRLGSVGLGLLAAGLIAGYGWKRAANLRRQDVRVVQLPIRSLPTGEQRNVDWSGRWPVRGHERKLASGKTTWVRPYIKGPDGAPLLTERT
jgi:hypothetical protein